MREAPASARGATLFAGVVLGTLVLGGCAQSYGEFPANKSYESITADGAYVPVDGTTVTLDFVDDRLSAEAGCNRLFGTVDMSAGTLNAGSLASSRMACSEELTRQDEWLSRFLTSKPSWSRGGGTMTLDNGSDRIVFSER